MKSCDKGPLLKNLCNSSAREGLCVKITLFHTRHTLKHEMVGWDEKNQLKNKEITVCPSPDGAGFGISLD